MPRKVHYRPNDTYSPLACGRAVGGWIDYLETTPHWHSVTCKDCLRRQPKPARWFPTKHKCIKCGRWTWRLIDESTTILDAFCQFCGWNITEEKRNAVRQRN